MKKIYGRTNAAVLTDMGKDLRQMRLNARLNQQDVADRAGISRKTLSLLENGKGGTLDTMVSVLRALDVLDLLDIFATEAQVSPIQYAKLSGKQPKRIRKPYGR